MAPVMVDLDLSTLDRKDLGEDEVELVEDLDVYQGATMCNCSASDDNPY